MSTPAELNEIVAAAARMYAARHGADRRELMSVAWLSGQDVVRSWCPERGPLKRFAWPVICRALNRFIVKQRAPVSLHNKKGDSALRFDLVDPGDVQIAAPAQDAAEALDNQRRAVAMVGRMLDLVGPEMLAMLTERARRARSGTEREARMLRALQTLRDDAQLRAMWEHQ